MTDVGQSFSDGYLKQTQSRRLLHRVLLLQLTAALVAEFLHLRHLLRGEDLGEAGVGVFLDALELLLGLLQGGGLLFTALVAAQVLERRLQQGVAADQGILENRPDLGLLHVAELQLVHHDLQLLAGLGREGVGGGEGGCLARFRRRSGDRGKHHGGGSAGHQAFGESFKMEIH